MVVLAARDMLVYGELFFFSSRRRHTRLQGDWSSDVCSSDLPGTGGLTRVTDKRKVRRDHADIFCTNPDGVRGQRAKDWRLVDDAIKPQQFAERSEERRVGKEGRSRWSPYH